MRARRGFALFELLVAVAIFALIAVFAYAGLNGIVRTRGAIEAQAARLKSLQIAVTLLDRDLATAMSRPIRDGYGREQPALAGAQGLVELSHAAPLRADGSTGSMIERVRWQIEDDTLVRRRFPVLDRASELPPAPRELVDQARELRLRYLDRGGNWRDAWPPQDAPAPRELALPRAVEYRLRLDDYGEIVRRVVLPDELPPETAPASAGGTDEPPAATARAP